MATPGGGGLTGQLFETFYSMMNKKKAPPPVPDVLKPVVEDKPKTAGKAKKPVEEILPTVIPRETAKAQVMPYLQGLTTRKPMSIDELMAAAEKLGLKPPGEGAVQIPPFDVSDLMPDQAALQEQLSNMPVDIRPIANLMDTIYKTNVSSRTPNLPDEYLTQLRAKAGLSDGGQAIKQVMGQARLAEYKAKLDQQGNQTPLQWAHTLKYLADALGGGGGTAAAAALDKINLGIAENNMDRATATNKENRQIAEEQRKGERDFIKELEKDPVMKNYKEVQVRSGRLRAALAAPKGGLPDITAVREYLRALEPSAVMFNEQESIAKGQGIIERIKSLIPNYLAGGQLGEKAKADMLSLSTEFENLAEADANAAISAGLQSAADSGYDPARIKKYFKTRLTPKPDIHKYILNGDEVEVEGRKLDAFKKKYPNAKPLRR